MFSARHGLSLPYLITSAADPYGTESDDILEAVDFIFKG